MSTLTPAPRATPMRRCVGCREAAATWTWQPFGPGATLATFTTPGSHYRGFPALALCDPCKAAVEAGTPIQFLYKQRIYDAAGGQVHAAPF